MSEAKAMKRQIDALYETLLEAGFEPIKPNEEDSSVSFFVAKGGGRIDIELDEPDLTNFAHLFDGCALKINRRGLYEEKQRVMHAVMTSLYAAGIFPVEPCEDWRDVIAASK